MKSNIIPLIFTCFCISALAQVGVNTPFVSSGTAVHVDGSGDNSSSIPSPFEAINDALITKNGQLIFGLSSGSSNSVLVSASDKGGFLLPRVALVSASNSTTPINTPATGLLVYNTATANIGTDEEVLEKNVYRWNGSTWKILSTTNNLPPTDTTGLRRPPTAGAPCERTSAGPRDTPV